MNSNAHHENNMPKEILVSGHEYASNLPSKENDQSKEFKQGYMQHVLKTNTVTIMGGLYGSSPTSSICDHAIEMRNVVVSESDCSEFASVSEVKHQIENTSQHIKLLAELYSKPKSEDTSTWPAVACSLTGIIDDNIHLYSLSTTPTTIEPSAVSFPVVQSTCYSTARNKITDNTIKQGTVEPVASIQYFEQSKQRRNTRFKQQKSTPSNYKLHPIDKSLDFGEIHLNVPKNLLIASSKPRYHKLRSSQSPVANRFYLTDDWKHQSSVSSVPTNNSDSQSQSTSSSVHLKAHDQHQQSRSLGNLSASIKCNNNRSLKSNKINSPSEKTFIEPLPSPPHHSRDFSSVGAACMRANGSSFGQIRTLLTNPNKSQPNKHNANTTELIVVDPRTQLIDLEKGSPGAPTNYRSTAINRQLSDDRSTTSTNMTTNNNLGGVTVVSRGHLQTSKSHDSSNASAHLPPNSRATKVPTNTRLARRQTLYAARKLLADWALVFAMLGIIMMIVENELTAADVYGKTSDWSYGIKLVIVGSTVILLILIAQYHYVEVMLFMNDNSAEDWRIAMSLRRTVQIIIEVAVCAVCPIPGDFYFVWTTVHADGQTKTSTEVPIDVTLSIPMFFRLYLICRVMLLHSRLFTDASSRSIGALNRVNFNARFVLKTLMTLCPGTVLLVVVATFWIIASWILRLCERYHTGDPVNIDALKHQNYLNSLWMITITFLSVGYGDMVPNTYCGRAVAVISGIMGVSTSSLVVAVIARKLELTRAEKHVHNFMMDTQLTKRLKHAAANVLRETWLIYKYRRLVDKFEVGKIRQHQRKFLLAIYELRKVKRDQRKLAENSMTIGDIAKSSQGTYELMNDMTEWQDSVSDRLGAIDTQMQTVQHDMRRLTHLLEKSVGLGSVLKEAGAVSLGDQPSDNLDVRQRKGKLEKRSVTGSSDKES